MRSWLGVWLLLGATAARATTYEVGDGQPYGSIGSVPWETLVAGDTVRIHARATPYHEKWVVNGVGTQSQPILIQGVPDAQGNLPVISGDSATTRSQLSFSAQARGILKIGASSNPPDGMPSYIVVDGLHFLHAHPDYSFFDSTGTGTAYTSDASGIYLEKGAHITVSHCEFELNANGFFAATYIDNSSDFESIDVKLIGNHLHDNGVSGSIFQHQSYTEAQGILFEANRYGPPCPGCGGNAIKDRSSGTVIRYNWIEGGGREMDLVESEFNVISGSASYVNTFVYGNVVLEPAGTDNNQLIHFGGDHSGYESYFRPNLYFWNNTFVSSRTDKTTLLALATSAQTAFAFNNIVDAAAYPGALSMLDDDGTIHLSSNWLSEGWVNSHGTLDGTVDDQGDNLMGTTPGFVSEATQDFDLRADAPTRDQGRAPLPAVAAYPLTQQYLAEQSLQPRPQDDALDLGGYGYQGAGSPTDAGTRPPVTDGGVTVLPDGGTVPVAVSVQGCTCGATSVASSWAAAALLLLVRRRRRLAPIVQARIQPEEGRAVKLTGRRDGPAPHTTSI